MELWQSLFLGVVQGATEFLPVSSSGHLFLTETWLGLAPDINFTILLHVASLIAVVVVYRTDIIYLIAKAFAFQRIKAGTLEPEGVLAWQLVAATICTVGVVLLIEPYFENLLVLPWVAGMLVITGLLIVAAERLRPQKERVFNWRLALILGLVQGLAVIPGISRSGLTIALLIMLGINRQESLRLSFLLSIPTILGALVFMLKDQWGSLNFNLTILVGFLASFLTALLAIYTMKNLVEKRWIWFAPYCIVLGGGIFMWLQFI
jgi:undecaprenyl-diphosphatase